jgi:hypothetical protein
MYSKMEVCFTAILTLIVLGHPGSQKIPARTCSNGTGSTVADGGHPPPPIPSTADAVQVLRADGGHPPPPMPPRQNTVQALRADGGHPPPTPWFSSLGS